MYIVQRKEAGKIWVVDVYSYLNCYSMSNNKREQNRYGSAQCNFPSPQLTSFFLSVVVVGPWAPHPSNSLREEQKQTKVTVLSLYCHYIYCHCTVTVLSLYCHCTVTVLSLYCHCTVTVLSLYCHCIVNLVLFSVLYLIIIEGTINCTAKKKVALTKTWHKDIRLKLHTGILFLKGGIELRVRLVTDQSVKGGPPPVCNQNRFI